MFVADGIDEPRPIASMPGVVQHTRDSVRRAAADAVAAGVGGLMLFGVPRDQDKDATGTSGTDPDGILNVALRDLSKDLGEATVLMADTCLDEFTDHGHCGVLDPATGDVDNDTTVELYADLAVLQAGAGADVIAPSGMMDGQVAGIRSALDGTGHPTTAILAYAAKYASALYGPFREAADVTIAGGGDRKGYQQDPRNGREALAEVVADVAEGADMVMVKPGMPYLDIVRRVKETFGAPTFVYQVSGEYAMIMAAGQNGWIDADRAMMESLIGFKRAGADGVLTYFAPRAAQALRKMR
jgi:porphobilinogen synthase